MFKHTKKILAALFILAGITLFISCQDDQSIPTANDQISLPKLGEFSLPAGVTLTSATLFVYEEVYDNDHVINVHKVTSNWEENLVTWNTKPTYDAALTSYNSFPGAGWRSVVITALVQDWIDNGGNYGLLLDEVAAIGGFAHYNSRENATNQPYLHLVTSVGDTDLAPIADCSIWENEPDNNKNGEILTVGRSDVTGFIKQSLIQFEYIPTPPGGGCTLTPGYWKTHSEFGPAPYDDTWAQLPNGASTIFFLSGQTYYEVLWTSPAGNAYYNLSFHYIAAGLNFMNGADPSAAQAAYDAATILFNTYTPAQIAVLRGSDPLRQQFISLAGILGQYNEGFIGPGHCDELIL